MDERGSFGARSERSARSLDSELDREELRSRYYGLMQELRVLLPGVQVLVAFLLIVPFNQRFGELDEVGRMLYGLALTSGMAAVAVFLAPAAHHRVGDRRDRSERVELGIVMTRLGLVLLATSLVTAMSLVVRFVFGAGLAALCAGLISGIMVWLWLWVPLRSRFEARRRAPGR